MSEREKITTSLKHSTLPLERERGGGPHPLHQFLFCPKCGSKKIVKTTLFGIPEILYDECPECHEKIDLDKPVNKD